eukprot:GHVL01042177.1.p1 GENE.GHVL01042177.1~~GHVL01042177.1.p1  ORF type:complete len:319 (+),score=20.62 GHVL01042177.1:39-995(+)
MSNKNVISPPGHYPATQVAPIGNPYYHNKSFSASQPSAQTYGHPVNSSGHNSTNTQPNFNNNGEYKQSYPYLSSQQTVHPHQSYGQFICTNDPTCITMDLPLQIRHRFIQKVFLILALQLVLTFGIALLFHFYTPLRNWVRANWWVWLVSLLLSFALLITLSCNRTLARKWPANFIFLFALTLCQGVFLGAVAATHSSNAVLFAIGITAVITVCLILFAWQTKWDFTGYGVFLFVGIIGLILFGIFASIFRNSIFQLIYASLGAIVFSFFIVYDAQQIIGGKNRKYQLNVDDYIFGALALYMDIINLFLIVLNFTRGS